MTFTWFPGLDVQLGRWHHELYPWCGCDMCDDDPLHLLEELNSTVRDLVAGNVVEQLKRGWRGGEISFRTPSRGKWTPLDGAQTKAAGPAVLHAWAAWTPRVGAA